MSFSPNRLYAQVDSPKITERTDGNTKDIYTLGSKSFNVNPNNIPSYSSKVYDQYIVTSSITSPTLIDGAYCPYNYYIYFSNNNILYRYSIPDIVVTSIASTTYNIYGVCYAPSSNRIFYTWGNPLSQSAPKGINSLKCDTGSITSITSLTDPPGKCAYIPKTNKIYMADTGKWNWIEAIDATTLVIDSNVASWGTIKEFINCPSLDIAFGIKETGDICSYNSYYSPIGTISSGSSLDAYRMAYCPTTDKIYITSNSGMKIFIADPISYNTIKTISLGSTPQEIAYIPSCNRVMFTMDDNVYAINPSTQTIVGTITGIGSYTRFLVYSPYDDRIYVAVSGAITSFKYW